MKKKWVVATKISQIDVDQFPQIDPLILQLLFNRDLKEQKAIDEFLGPDFISGIYDPYLIEDMEKAVKRIIQAINKREKITVYGDYDADGVCASVVLVDMLKLLDADVGVYIPHREKEGYGMRPEVISQLAEDGCTLIITDDCGISNKREVEHANKLGVDVIITDHHHPPHPVEKLPPAYAIIHTRVRAEKYPFKPLAGVGAAFKLVQGIIKADFDPEFSKYKDNIIGADGQKINWEGYEKWLLDLVCIATITDSMPLYGENRTLVKFGLIVLNKTKRLGIKEILKKAGHEGKLINTHTIGFIIGPRINAAGRVDHASVAFELVMAKDQEEAVLLADKLEKTNIERQKIAERIYQEASKQVEIKSKEGKTVLYAIGNNWPLAVLGLVAGKLADQYYRPVILMTRARDGVDGSARSIDIFSIIEALENSADMLERFGGHTTAAGFTLKAEADVEEFMARIEGMASKALAGADLTPLLPIDAEINLNQVNWNFWDNLEKFEPFGSGNPKPVFLVKNANLTNISTVGKTNKHLRISVSKDGFTKRAIGFSFGSFASEATVGDKVDFVCEVDVNEWNGNRELQLKIVDIVKSENF